MKQGIYTLVGTNYVSNHEAVKDILHKARFAEAVKGFLVRDPAFQDATCVYAINNSKVYQVGVLGVNYVLNGTNNGREISSQLKVGEVQPVSFDITSVSADEFKKMLREFNQKGNQFCIRLSERELLSNNAVGAYFPPELIRKHKIERFVNSKPKRVWDDEEEEVKDMSYYSTSANTSSNVPRATSGGTVISGSMPNRISSTSGSALGYTYQESCDGNLTQNYKDGGKGKMKNLNGMFSKFGKDFSYPTSNFALSLIGGGLAVKQGAGFVTFNAEKKESMDVMDFVMDGFEDMIMILPVQELKDGDIFIQDGKVYQMIDAKENQAYCYTDNTIDQLVSKANIMGFKMYAKVMNLMAQMGTVAGAEGQASNGMFGNMNPMMMMMMMKGDSGDSSDMMKMMMMSQMFSGNGIKLG